MSRGRWASVVAGIAAVAAFAVSATPASALSTSVSNSTKTVTCTVEARTPTFTKASNGTVTVTGVYRIACTRTNASVTSVNLNVLVGAVEMDLDRLGKFTVIDSKVQLADYNPGTITYKFGTYTYLDVVTKSFTCINTDMGSNDSEEISTKVKIGLVSGVWSSIDYSSSYLSAPC